MSLVSIIIPTYNMAHSLGHAIESVLKGSYQDVEVVVVNDGSTDDTSAVCDSYTTPDSIQYDPRVRYIVQHNGGKASAVNRGLAMASGDYIAILDADDRLTPNSVSARMPRFLLEPSIDLVIGAFKVFDDSEPLGQRPAPATDDQASLLRQFWLSYKTPFHMNSCLFKRSLYERVGNFDERLRRCQDIDYSMRLLQESVGLKVIEEIVYCYQKHRSDRSQRLRYRWRTFRHRPIVFWKNCPLIIRPVAVLLGAVVDFGKGVYELAGNYEQ